MSSGRSLAGTLHKMLQDSDLSFRDFVEAGGLLSYGVDAVDLFRRASEYVSRILRGANPADLPVQAPTKFALISPDNRKTIDYLHTTSPDLDLSRYKGLHIIVTGEEGLDERWGNTPVITIQKIEVVE